MVYLVGAGPGDPGLLTLRAVECLMQADLVLYDRLVSARALDHAPSSAVKKCVTELAERHADRQDPVHQTMIEAARGGQCVVRLKGGDPFLFGRGGEEAEALRQAGISFEIVPGVSAALGAAACAGIPLTHRLFASGVALVTGHEDPAKPESALDWGALARFPGTLVLYMGMSRLVENVQKLIRCGKDPATPAAAVRLATTGEQQTVEAPLAHLPEAVRQAGLTAPAVVLIGEVVTLRAKVSWFERRPLFGKRLLVTRPRPQAGEIVRRLELLGATVSVLPAVEISPPDDWTPVDQALDALSRYQWLAFTSVNGVKAFLTRLRERGKDLRALGGLRLAAIGPATADALRSYHLEPDLVPGEYRSEALAAALREHVAGQAVLLARADRGREVLREQLAEAAALVDQVTVYSQRDALDATSPVLEAFRRGELDYVTLTSSNIARAFVRALDEGCRSQVESGRVELVSISPVTSAAVRELGLPVAAEAVEYTTTGVVNALVQRATSTFVSCHSSPGG